MLNTHILGSYNCSNNKFNICKDNIGVFIEMFGPCETPFLFDVEDLSIVTDLKTNYGNKVTWKISNGDIKFVFCSVNKKIIYLHNFVSNNERVIHLDNNTLNNRKYNLKSNEDEKNKGTYKKNRRRNAVDLPSELNNIMIPKYIVYYKEKINNKFGYRDFFCIEKHPIQQMGLFKKKWCSSKSMSITPTKKLNDSIEKLNILDDWYSIIKIEQTPTEI